MAKNIPAILADLETDLLKRRLYDFPGQIRAQKRVVREHREAYDALQQEARMLEAELATDISAETNPNNGKPAYSNKEAREAELEQRKGADIEYMEAAQKARKAGWQLEEAQDELEKIQDEYKSYRYVVGMVTKELAVYALDEEQEDGRREATGNGQLY